MLPDLDSHSRGRALLKGITSIDIIDTLHNTSRKELTAVEKGPKKGNESRKLAMYLCQELADAKLSEIAQLFNLTHNGSVSYIVNQVRTRKQQDNKFAKRIDKTIYPKSATSL